METKKNPLIQPIVVLICIGLVASLLLSVVYGITSPIIAQREADTKNAALKIVLPEGDNFTKVEPITLIAGVTEAYKADNGAGYVFSTNCKSQQGGEVQMVVGVNSKGEVCGMSVIKHNETAGIGDKVLQESYFKTLYSCKSVEDVSNVAAISGATKTSNAVKESAQVALQMYANLTYAK